MEPTKKSNIEERGTGELSPDVMYLKSVEELKTSEETKRGGGLQRVAKSFQSSNYKPATLGWKIDSNGKPEFNGTRTVSTNFKPVLFLGRITIYVSDGTTPNGNLSGNAGDICFGGPTGNAFKCTSTTTWVSFT